MNYPEHEKLLEHEDEHRVVQEFLEWLTGEGGITLAERKSALKEEFEPRSWQSDPLWPTPRRKEALVAAFFNVNLEAFQAEKEEMFASIREGEE